MKLRLIFIITSITLISCKSSPLTTMTSYGSPNEKLELLDNYTFKIDTYSNDPSYGYTEENPIMVGGDGLNPKNLERFLNALMGPNGEEIRYSRGGSCCSFHTKRGLLKDRGLEGLFGNNIGLLDIYIIEYDGLKKPIVLYINMHDSKKLQIPLGFNKKK